MYTAVQFRIAVRIHYALKPHLGEGIDVEAMLTQPNEAREVLYVCQALGTPELLALAHQFSVASRVATAAPAPQDMPWAKDTSGFGLSQSAVMHGPVAAKPAKRRWFGLAPAAKSTR